MSVCASVVRFTCVPVFRVWVQPLQVSIPALTSFSTFNRPNKKKQPLVANPDNIFFLIQRFHDNPCAPAHSHRLPRCITLEIQNTPRSLQLTTDPAFLLLLLLLLFLPPLSTDALCHQVQHSTRGRSRLNPRLLMQPEPSSRALSASQGDGHSLVRPRRCSHAAPPAQLERRRLHPSSISVTFQFF